MKTMIVFEPFPAYRNRVSLFDRLVIDNDSIVFLGDSMTQRNEWAESLQNPAIKNRGIDSDTVAGVLSRLHQISLYRPKQVFLMIGVNDISHGKSKKYIVDLYRHILRKLMADSIETQIFIQSILPVNNSVYKHPMNNEVTKDINAALHDLAAECGVCYINLYDSFTGKDLNELTAEYTFDGVHLAGKGYALWVRLIKPFVYS